MLNFYHRDSHERLCDIGKYVIGAIYNGLCVCVCVCVCLGNAVAGAGVPLRLHRLGGLQRQGIT